MKVLLLHPNFPGQFKHLAAAFARTGHDTKFLCQTHYGRKVPGVQRIKLKNKYGHDALNILNLNHVERSQKLGLQFRSGLTELKKLGWNPDIIISHSGWGCGLYAKEVWPSTKFCSYLEWWFNPESNFFHHDKHNKLINLNSNSIKKCWARNQQVALELSVSDAIIAPTEWQKSQLPKILRRQCDVIFDGIDLSKFKPDISSQRYNVITYGTRGMDPMRSFPQFIQEISNFLSKNNEFTLEIAGEDEVFYGSQPKNTTWGKWARNLFNEKNVANRVTWLGKLNLPEYINWLKSSGCHVYTTHPFVASWSLVESYCCGLNLVVSNTDPVKEICMPEIGVEFCDHRLSGSMSQALDTILGNRDRSLSNNYWQEARNVKRFGIGTSLKSWSHVAGADLTTHQVDWG